jgi:Leucine-rich repeat (LRR) protein
MANILFKSLTLILFVTVTIIECQVILNRNQLASWIPSYLTDTTISLKFRNISLVDSATFSGLPYLRNLYLNPNSLTQIDSNTFSGLTNLLGLDLGANKLTNTS